MELAERRRMTAHPTDYLRRIWYDCITYDPGALRYLISVVGADRVLFGTDWPHQVHDVVGLAREHRGAARGPARRHPRHERDRPVRAVRPALPPARRATLTRPEWRNGRRG